KGHKLRVHVPIKIVGTAIGTRDGGILEHALHEFEIEALAEKLPESISVDVSELVVGHAIHVRDVVVPDGVKILNNAEQVVAIITHAKAEVVEAPVAAAATEEAAAPADAAAGAAAKAAPAAKKE